MPAGRMNAILKPDRDTIQAACYEQLRDELLDALENDPQRIVRTPGFGPTLKYSAAAVVADELSGRKDDALHYLLRIVTDAAKGQDVHLRAAVWLADRAAVHALYHAQDLAYELEGDL